MEAILFNDQGAFLSPARNTTTCDNSKLWLSLTSDCKNYVKKDDFDFTDLLHSPDFNITSPSVESLFLKSLESPPALRVACLSPVYRQQDVCRPETCVTATQASVTREQEIFAQGFTDALKKIQRREEATKDDHMPQRVKQEPCDKNEEEAVENTKYCFISYDFDSSAPLPSFREAFSSSVELSEREISLKSEYQNITNASQDCVFWDKIETVDEGFSVHSRTCSLREFTNASPDSCDDDSDVSISSPATQSPLYGNDIEAFHFPYETEENIVGSGSNLEGGGWVSNLQTTGDVQMEKHWLTIRTKHCNTINQSDAMPTGCDLQDLIKIEHQKHNNRLAAWKSRQKKLVPESCLETTVEELFVENARLQEQLNKLRRKRQRLQDAFNKPAAELHKRMCSTTCIPTIN